MTTFISTSQRLIVKHRLILLTLFFGVFIPLLIFGKLAEDVWNDGGFAWDIPILQIIHQAATPSRDTLMIFVTRLGGLKVMMPFSGAIFIFLIIRKRLREALFLTLAVGGAAVINVLAKLFFHRMRPHLWTSPVPEYDYGFPSGHAMGTMAVILTLVILTWSTRYRWLIVVLGTMFVVGVGVSRLYLGVHFPSDVVAGWSAALIWVIGVHQILSHRFVQSRINQPTDRQ